MCGRCCVETNVKKGVSFRDRHLLVTDHTHFPEIDPERGQIFRYIADVLILGAARQDLVADHQERGDFFGSGCVGGYHDHLRRRIETAEMRRTSITTNPYIRAGGSANRLARDERVELGAVPIRPQIHPSLTYATR